MTRYYLGISSATSIELSPDEDMSIGKKISLSQQRTAEGYMYENKTYDFNSISIPLVHIPASVAYAINSLWLTQTPLLFIISGDAGAGDTYLTYQPEAYYGMLHYPGRYWPKWQGQTEVYSCYLSGDEVPLKSMSLPYDNHFKGTIKLEGY